MDTREYHQKYYQEHKENWEKHVPAQRQWARDHREHLNELNKGYKQVDPERYKRYGVNYRQRVKLDVLSHYSNGELKCAHCGIDDIDVLCIDHINNDGASLRKQWGLGSAFYKRLIQAKYPEGYQILCWNCNHKKELERRRNGQDV